MDRTVYSLRPFVDEDYEAEARIDHALDPGVHFTAAEIRHGEEVRLSEPGRVSVKRVVEEIRTRTVVGYGGLQSTSYNFHPQKFAVWVSVHPAHQHQGIGRELYSLLEHEATERHAICLWTQARADDLRSVSFMDRNRFVERRRSWKSRLELAQADLAPVPDRTDALGSRGIRFTTLAAEGADRAETRRRLFELNEQASAAIPRLGEYTPVSFEEFTAFEFDSPQSFPEGVLIACRDTEYVGMTTLMRQLGQADTLLVGFTGTHPDFRRLGIARELKRRAVLFARDRGYRYLETYNDSLNVGIWAINSRLGFRQQQTWIFSEKPLSGGTR